MHAYPQVLHYSLRQPEQQPHRRCERKLVLDVGSNHGIFTLYAARTYGDQLESSSDEYPEWWWDFPYTRTE